MMKVGILHQDLESQEIYLQEELVRQGIDSKLIDVRKTDLNTLSKNDLVLNRVFASVANRDYRDNVKTLEYLKSLEGKGVVSINSYFTTLCDYNKYFSSKIMEDNNVMNPKTFLVQNFSHFGEAKRFSQDVGFQYGDPVVLKRNMGGRGKDVFLVNSSKDLEKMLEENLSNNSYGGGYVIQEFVRSVVPFDYRISVIDGDIVYSMTRSFIDSDKCEPWISSMSLGSIENVVDAPKDVQNLALEATKSIGAFFNDVDIVLGNEGPYVIENNPTPNFAVRQKGNQSEKREKVLNKLSQKIKSYEK